ncbi:MAG: exodeoxyribonuclease III [Alphaproteobacteria bacterium]|nr:exodeoxyribonuclease III [Alphaproteobacteria bacterium]MBV9692952.1 exodeoxyribonuclease III [Alphaproteobacteria bacterium]
MKIATWNINSVRLRRNLVTRFLRAEQPDVLALQETKVVNDLFPAKPFAALGYVHQAIHGQKGYHGVALLSRLPFRESRSQEFCSNSDCRHIQVRFENGIELHDFYVPAGGDIPDPKRNPKFAHKLDFLREMCGFFESRGNRGDALVLLGDLNVAPLEHDVWSHRQLLDVVSHTPVETALLGDVKASFEWIDVTRRFVPENEKIFSWWSYRAVDWAASDRGRRLDHIWVSPALGSALRSQAIVKKMRGWKLASDHVPVVAELAL